MKKEYICIVCPKGCHITVDGDNITGYTCLRGLNYVKQESIDPRRVLTTTVKVDDEHIKVCPVRSNEALPKDKIFDCMNEINKVSLKSPIKMHQVVVENILGTGIDIVATKEIK